MIKAFFYFLFGFIIFLCFSTVIGGAGILYYYVVLEPGNEIEASNIEAILGQESPVFYNDNETKLGVIFDEAHRQYVEYQEIPEDFVKALVAAEDNRFFSHFGFDIIGIGRAIVKNVEAGRVVQGGSTLTQQTAKNLFKRSERSFKAKFIELLYALRLEYHYPKEKIFEFYANQFYVSGNGHGLGVAARYYFDKTVSEMTLGECAFVAGSVKRPNYYNPFIKKTEEDAEEARIRAKERQTYVLDKMLELKMITSELYNEALTEEITFNQGQVGYTLDYVMDLVKSAVSSDEVLAELEKHGINNVSTSGVRIITSVNKNIQDRTLYALRHDLSRLDVQLRGYERDEVQKEYSEIDYTGDDKVEINSFLFGNVTEVAGKGEDVVIHVDFGRKLGTGILDVDGLTRLVEERARWENGRWAKVAKKDLQRLVEQIVIGDRIWVSVRKVDEAEGVFLDLEKYPLVQGGAIVVQDGAIRAMAGGTENRFFNRATAAKRTMGSSFKPFVYTAALQLGWSSSDLLKNSRDVFIYHNQPYFPRPDHFSPHEHVSMSWAGVKSENVASVWLLVHLCDYLDQIQFRDLATHLGLTPQVVDGQVESYKSYRARIRDSYGIQINTDTLRASAFKAALRNSETDFMFENMIEDYSFLKSINYGQNYDRFRKQLERDLSSQSASTDAERKELRLRGGLLNLNYLSLKALRTRLSDHVEQIIDASTGFDQEFSAARGYVDGLYLDMGSGRYIYQPGKAPEGSLYEVDARHLQAELFGRSIYEREQFWAQVYLYGKVSVAALDMVTQQMEIEYQRLERELPYSFEVLSDVDDFRIFTGLKYLIALAQEMGVKSDLQPVLSFPLGSNVVSLLEAVRMYEGLVTGSISTYGVEANGIDSDSLLIIDRIESEEGEVLYKPEQHAKTVVGVKERLAVGHILENVIKFGTGNNADKQVRIALGKEDDKKTKELALPLLGKTGTANDYTNAAFLGYLPGLTDTGGLTAKNGYAVGVYVGFDGNDSMRRSNIRISGSAGALPTWIDVVKAIIEEDKYAERIDTVDLAFNGGLSVLRESAGQLNLAVDNENGGIVTSPAQIISETSRYSPSILTFGAISADGRFIPQRNYEPFWRAEEQAAQ